MIAQHEKLAHRRHQAGENIPDPVDPADEVANIAGDGHDVGLQFVGQAHHLVKERGLDPATEMEVGQVQHRDPVQRDRQPLDLDFFFVDVDVKQLVARHVRKQPGL